MARFRFKFQKVLNARQTIEKNRKRDLLVAQNQLADLLREKKRIADEIKEQQYNFSLQRDHEEKASTWAVTQSYLDMLSSLKKAVGVKIEKQQAKIEEKRALLMEARRERRAMEILREKQHEEHIANENRQEQIFLNEIAQFQTIKKRQETE